MNPGTFDRDIPVWVQEYDFKARCNGAFCEKYDEDVDRIRERRENPQERRVYELCEGCPVMFRDISTFDNDMEDEYRKMMILWEQGLLKEKPLMPIPAIVRRKP